MLTFDFLWQLDEFRLGHLADRGLMRELHVRTGRQTVALRAEDVVDVVGRLLHRGHGTLHAGRLLRRADGHQVGVPRHVVGDTVALLERVVGRALLEAVEEGVVLEVLQRLLPLQVAVASVDVDGVDGLVGVDYRGRDGDERLRAGADGKAVLDHLRQGHWSVQ